jgi:hypothetical protein
MSAYRQDPFQSTLTESDVVAVVRECLRDWPPSDLIQLPQECRPGKIRDGEDIAELAFTLTRTRIDSHESNDLLVKLETLFAHACQRLGRIESDASSESSDNSQERH